MFIRSKDQIPTPLTQPLGEKVYELTGSSPASGSARLHSLPLFNWERPVVTAPGLQGVQPSPFAFGSVEDTWNIFSWIFDFGE